MIVEIDKRMFIGPLVFSCRYHSQDEKYELYEWLTQNFGGVMPSLEYSVAGTKNDTWFVCDEFLLHPGIGRLSGSVRVVFYDDCEATAFKLRWW